MNIKILNGTKYFYNKDRLILLGLSLLYVMILEDCKNSQKIPLTNFVSV